MVTESEKCCAPGSSFDLRVFIASSAKTHWLWRAVADKNTIYLLKYVLST